MSSWYIVRKTWTRSLKLHQVSAQYGFNFDQIKPEQTQVIQSIVDKHDTIAVLPTGFDQSFCFVAPLLIKKKMCMFVMPEEEEQQQNRANNNKLFVCPRPPARKPSFWLIYPQKAVIFTLLFYHDSASQITYSSPFLLFRTRQSQFGRGGKILREKRTSRETEAAQPEKESAWRSRKEGKRETSRRSSKTLFICPPFSHHIWFCV